MDTPTNSTTATAYAALHGTSMEQLRATREARIPLGRFGSAFDVANAALFLASDDDGYVTAQEIVVDGGLVNKAG